MKEKSETPELIVLMGLQGAGKSGFYRRNFAQDHVLISKDLMKNKKQKQIIQERELRNNLQKGLSVVVDNMNLTKSNRRALLSIANEFRARAFLFYFPMNFEESLARNLGPNRKAVPPVAVYSSVKILEEPTLDEGFDEIYIVRMLSTEEFLVKRFESHESSFQLPR